MKQRIKLSEQANLWVHIYFLTHPGAWCRELQLLWVLVQKLQHLWVLVQKLQHLWVLVQKLQHICLLSKELFSFGTCHRDVIYS